MNRSAVRRELINVAVLGIILLAAAGVLTAAVVTSNTGTVSVDLWGVTVTNLTLGVVFVAGMITTVLAVVGLGLLMGGMRRTRRLRQERRALRRENEELTQRVDTAPADEHALRYDDRPAVVHDDRTQVMHDDRGHYNDGRGYPGPEAARQNDRVVAEEPQGDRPSGRPFLPRRDNPVSTDSSPRPD